MSWTIATKDDVYSLYKQDKTTLEDNWSENAEALLLEYINKSIGEITTDTSFTEYISGKDGAVLITEKPISSLTSITILKGDADDESVDLGDIRTVSNEIIYENNTFPEGSRNIKVEYDGTIPNKKVYNLTVTLMIIAQAHFEGRKGSDADIEWANLSSEFGNNTANEDLGLVSHLNAILDEFIGRKQKVKIR